MRKAIAAIICMVVLNACSGSREASQLRKGINGSWVLETITTDGIKGKFTAKVFNEADYTCFIHSTWNFIANNSSGNYILDGSTQGCNPLTRLITWSIYEPKDAEKEFQFKRMENKKTPMDGGNGYRLRIISLSDTAMKLRSDISYEGKPAGIIYNFTRK